MFKGLEGLRAWLAWTVVFSHVALVSGLTEIVPKGKALALAGDYAVKVFIIVSGFVIANLIVTKAESYPIYIARRFLRIYPAYLVALCFSIATATLAYRAILNSPNIAPFLPEFFAIQEQQFRDNFWPQLAAHITLAQGVFPNNVLPQSQYMFVAPAWSLSLEWQFYLIAPLWIGALRRYPYATISFTFAAALFYNIFLDDRYFSPSFLPGAVIFFLLGIASRIFIPLAPRLENYPLLIVYGSLGLALIKAQFIVISIWIGVVSYLMQDKKWLLLDGPLAQAAGSRSYCVYIIHYPILLISLYITTEIFHLSSIGAIPSISILAITGTVAAAELLHRWVELPSMNFARSLGRVKPALA
jgi:peptidoglycan/LPS O-acetylase OafA/YrhL